jgi:hypothetical protein
VNAPIDTLAFAERFEEAGFGHEQARALVQAIQQAQDNGREELVTKSHLDLRLAELTTQMREMEVRLTKQIGDNGKDISNRLWSTVTIIAGVATAISATVGAGVVLLLKAGGL